MDDDYSSIEISPEQNQIQDLIIKLSDIDLDSESRDIALYELKNLSKLSYVETILSYCTSYEENKSSVLKEFLNELCDSQEIDIQLRLRCAESIDSPKTCIKVLNECIGMSEETLCKQEVNFVIIIDYINKYIKDYHQDLDMLISFCINTPNINVQNKVKLLNSLEHNMLIHINEIFNVLSKANMLDRQLYTIQVYQLALKHNALTSERLDELSNELLSETDDAYKGNIADFFLSLPDEFSNYKTIGQKYIESFSKTGTIWTNKQMIHQISADAERFIDCIADFEHNDDFFDSVSKSNMFTSTGCSISIARISTDNSVYGKRNVTLKWIFCKSIKYIQSRPESQMLLQRLVEELEDMSMTCSTGHLFRLMNTFSGLDNFIKIDPYEELKACVTTRLQKHISGMSEENAEIILNALMDQDELMLQKYLFPTFAHVCSELYDEYVKQGIISEHLFYEKYRESIMSFSGLSSN